MDKLEEMMLLQTALMDRLKVPRAQNLEAFDKDLGLQQAIPHYMYALVCELSEIGDAINWKSWKQTKKPLDLENLKMEFIDALHFLLEMMIMCGIDAKTIHEEYIKKNKENHDRQDRGY